MRRLILLLALFGSISSAAVTVFRVDPTPVMITAGTAPRGGYPVLMAVAGATINICTDPTCVTPQVTYTDISGETACPIGAPVVLAGTSMCTSKTDNRGNFGFWLPSPNIGTAYYYKIILPSGVTIGPYPLQPAQATQTTNFFIASAYPSLQAALTAAAVNGGTVLLSTMVNASIPITISSGVTLSCQAGGGLKLASGAWANFQTSGLIGNTADGIHDITIENCEIDGNQVNNSPSAPGVCALVVFGAFSGSCGAGGSTTANRMVVRNCYIHGHPGNGSGGGAAVFYAMAAGSGNKFIHNTITASNSIAGGILVIGPGILIEDNQLPGPWGDCGLTANGATAVGDIWIGNYMSGTAFCIESGASAQQVIGNTVLNPLAYAVSMSIAGEDCFISSNHLLGLTTGNSAIQFFAPYPTRARITNNHITRASGPPPNPGNVGLPSPVPSGYYLELEGIQGAVVPLTLVNGANENISISAGSTSPVLLEISGPTGAFSIGGFTGGITGRVYMLTNTTSQVMTLTQQSGGSIGANKLYIGGGTNQVANVAVLMYDGGSWVVTAYK